MQAHPFTTTLDEQRDALFLRYGKPDALWLNPFTAGDKIAVCSNCVSAIHAEDWESACPICGSQQTLVLFGANSLLAVQHSTHGMHYIETLLKPFSLTIDLKRNTEG